MGTAEGIHLEGGPRLHAINEKRGDSKEGPLPRERAQILFTSRPPDNARPLGRIVFAGQPDQNSVSRALDNLAEGVVRHGWKIFVVATAIAGVLFYYAWVGMAGV